MSFFIAKQAAKATAKAASKPFGAPRMGGSGRGAGRQQAAALARLGCTGCPLNKAPIITPKMEPTLKKGAKVYFLAESPGRDEDENTGKPLTGPSGRLLRECISDDVDCSFDNVLNCRPPKNRNPEWNEIQCCHPRRVKYIQEAKPLLIVGLGMIPLHAVLGSHDLQGMRGRLFAVKFGEWNCWFLPTYHPSFVLRVAKNKRKPLHSMMGHSFRMDLKRAFEYAEWLEPPQILTEKELKSDISCYDGTHSTHEEVVLGLLAEAGKAKEKAIDIETKGLRPYKPDAAIMSAAFSFGETNFSFALDHPKAGWTPKQKHTIKKAVGKILTDGHTKIAHNVPFEVEWFVHFYGREVARHHEWHCTQMQCHFLDERRGKAKSTDEQDRRAAYQALKFLVKEYFGIDHKSVFKLDKKDMSKSDLGETLIYNAADTKVTLMLHHWQTKLLKHFGLYEAYLEARPRQTSAAMMQHFGVHVDQKEVKAAQNKLKPEIKKLEADIADLKVVRAYVKDHGEFNPGSQDHVVEIFKDYLKRPEVEIKQERYEAHDFNKSSVSKKRYDDGNGTRYSVDKNVLDQIDHPLAGLIINWRNRTKLKSTYTDEFELGKGGLIYPDGFLHPNFNTTFAETGRYSSDEPNAQNFPKRKDEWVRKQIAAPDGHVLVAFDFGQLEGCTAAMCSKDKVLVKALWEGYDIHQEWAVKLAHRYPTIIGGKKFMTDAEIMDKLRSKVKNKLTFPAIFGAQNSSIAGHLEVPEDVIDDLMTEFWETFSGLADWQNKTMKKYYEVGYVESPTGRRRHYPMTRNQAINDPIQSVACDITCRGKNTLSELAAEEQAWHMHPVMMIHDDLIFCMPDDDKILEPAIEDVYRVMLTPGFDFINVPLSVKGTIGKHWYNMEKLGQFWSNRDV
jgi:uracil-DNA glycosylase family 4